VLLLLYDLRAGVATALSAGPGTEVLGPLIVTLFAAGRSSWVAALSVVNVVPRRRRPHARAAPRRADLALAVIPGRRTQAVYAACVNLAALGEPGTINPIWYGFRAAS